MTNYVNTNIAANAMSKYWAQSTVGLFIINLNFHKNDQASLKTRNLRDRRIPMSPLFNITGMRVENVYHNCTV